MSTCVTNPTARQPDYLAWSQRMGWELTTAQRTILSIVAECATVRFVLITHPRRYGRGQLAEAMMAAATAACTEC